MSWNVQSTYWTQIADGLCLQNVSPCMNNVEELVNITQLSDEELSESDDEDIDDIMIKESFGNDSPKLAKGFQPLWTYWKWVMVH